MKAVRQSSRSPFVERSTCPVCWSASESVESFRPVALCECSRCGLVFDPARSLVERRERYNEDYFDSFSALGAGYNDDPRTRAHQARVRVRFVDGYVAAPGRVLEIGAAAGYFLAAARSAGYEPLGVEPEAGMAAFARERFHVPVVEGFVEDLDIEPASYDVVCGWHVLEHILEPVMALERLREALRPGGYAIFEVPNLESTEAQRLGRRWAHLDLRHHVNHFTPRSLRHVMVTAGLQPVATETVAMWRYFRPGVALRPLHVARRTRLSLRARVSLRSTHPSKHELLRGVAKRID